ncbi:hypothetical protein Syun_019467 [Stephania yunnanensis]|uniref:Uncharacterized protein n=1 Tax=Stephania yunnanensis TaxID=152371 RepID=A0AAP0IUX5_9MAGN
MEANHAGAAIWGSSPSIDKPRTLSTTNNKYTYITNSIDIMLLCISYGYIKATHVGLSQHLQQGGIAGGTATDGKRVYTNIANSNGISFKFTHSNINTTAGAWVAMDAVTRKILWSIANPLDFPSNAPVKVANGVLFSGSPDPQGAVFAMDASSGRILWSYNTNATIYGGASISHGCVYLGNGYKVNMGPGIRSNCYCWNISFCLLCTVSIAP